MFSPKVFVYWIKGGGTPSSATLALASTPDSVSPWGKSPRAKSQPTVSATRSRLFWYFPALSLSCFARLIALEEQIWQKSFIGIDLGGERLLLEIIQGDKAFPFGFKRRNVHNDAAAGIGGFAYADGQDIARDFEIFHRTRQGKRVGRIRTDAA